MWDMMVDERRDSQPIIASHSTINFFNDFEDGQRTLFLLEAKERRIYAVERWLS